LAAQKEVQDEATWWFNRLSPLLPLKRGVVQAIDRLAEQIGKPVPTVRNKYYALKNHGLGGLIDFRQCGPEFWLLGNAETNAPLPMADQELLKDYLEKNQRSSDKAIELFRTDWLRGKIKTTQPINPETGFPRGYSQRNLARYASTALELEAARVGLDSARAKHSRLVYTSRKNLWAASHIQVDDMWHDLVVACLIERQTGRPLELFTHDLFTSRKLRWGFRVRTKRNDGSHKQLTSAMTRYVVAATLYLDGYSPRAQPWSLNTVPPRSMAIFKICSKQPAAG